MKMRRLIKLVKVMQTLPDDVMNRDALTNESNCNPLLGLISIVAEDIPKLKKYYKHSKYDNLKWKEALDDYLGVDLSEWSHWNSELWGNNYGDFLFWDFRYITMNYRYSFVALGKEPLGTIGTFKGAEELDILYNFYIVNHLIKIINKWRLLTFKEKFNLYLKDKRL